MAEVLYAKFYLTLETIPQDIGIVTMSALKVEKLRIRVVKNLFQFTKLVNGRCGFKLRIVKAHNLKYSTILE